MYRITLLRWKRGEGLRFEDRNKNLPISQAYAAVGNLYACLCEKKVRKI